LRLLENGRHRLPDRLRRRAGPPHHLGENVRIQHPVYRDVLGRGLETRDSAHRVNQRLPVMRARAAQERSIDIEK
jgi:hypothetical protein